jgi:hypothetical protein
VERESAADGREWLISQRTLSAGVSKEMKPSRSVFARAWVISTVPPGMHRDTGSQGRWAWALATMTQVGHVRQRSFHLAGAHQASRRRMRPCVCEWLWPWEKAGDEHGGRGQPYPA